ncbi:helix-turn-helix domain-containing protein [Chryseobacterium gwangjuense]|uniref:helix-turn-helix domain-containing protein n=1 Tax=Chryseobacterium gwangjuense TaxID=1069980 RepID=UPI001E29A6F6|nr:AraC family transcriptional regulator [Chryseobacterium gwangjuense]MCE3074980.1 AraC family transcriptional regulator [Chryseobacterium gwangjuense]
MKNKNREGQIYNSEEISIVHHTDSNREKSLSSNFIEGKHSFNLLFLLSPDIHLEANDCGTQFLFKKNEYILHYSSEESKAKLWSDHQEHLKYLQIQIRYQYIFNLFNPQKNKESSEMLEQMTKNNFIFLHEQTPPLMTVEMHIILQEIIESSKKGMMQKLFVEAKIMKLLLLIFEQFTEKDHSENHSRQHILIKKYIDENYNKNLKINDLSRELGINENKIRKEFKKYYHSTIVDYILELRMLKAKKLIINKNIMIKEIAIDCGYDYVQNFSRAFKKRFGLSPEKLRNG